MSNMTNDANQTTQTKESIMKNGNKHDAYINFQCQHTSSPFLLISFNPFLKKIIAPRGPRSDLWVVVVTTSAYSKGDGITPAATKPLMCAMSASKTAFCLSQTYQQSKMRFMVP